ncbi:MAG TPA: hypothetical protein PLB59_01850 [Bacteroidales bacterium]|nr:hypothetical protein [Bacteroidales bacterium]HNZ42121.1 hypothetical protein [Bacteroidales bacterium]HPB24338.1 hypothetical protein [Bacteroidales bacterium]HPI29005.1 hypothetical protein [Bacteroidales bacterium]HQP14686.1 hypothetical protein [Bacteroidales bacterium]
MPEISDDLIITIIFSLRHNSPFLQELWQVFQLLFLLFFLLLPFLLVFNIAVKIILNFLFNQNFQEFFIFFSMPVILVCCEFSFLPVDISFFSKYYSKKSFG